MEQIVIFLVVLVIVVVVFLFYEKRSNEVEMVTSTVDGKQYLVQKMPDNKQAANLIATIKNKLIRLVDYCKQEYSTNEDINRMAQKFNPNNITEVGKNSKYTSYSVNKGEKMVLCLRSRDGQDKLIDENTLTFVAIHELAHIKTKSIGHTDEFWQNFKFLLQRAIKLGLYDKVDYSKYPKPYCGIKVTDTPLNM
jgi:predicted metal-dependent hydrolase